MIGMSPLMNETTELLNVKDMLRVRLEILNRAAAFVAECLAYPEGAGDNWRLFMAEPTEWSGDIGCGPELLKLLLKETETTTAQALQEIDDHAERIRQILKEQREEALRPYRGVLRFMGRYPTRNVWKFSRDYPELSASARGAEPPHAAEGDQLYEELNGKHTGEFRLVRIDKAIATLTGEQVADLIEAAEGGTP